MSVAIAHKKMGVLKTDWLVCASIFLLSVFLMAWRLEIPAGLVFDETHYVPAGEAFFKLEAWLNNSHPPLAKWVIGAGSVLSGEQEYGWRLPGVLLGSLTVISMYAITRLFGLSIGFALLAAVLTVLNQTLIVQSRTAMLDIYSIGFFALCMWAFIWSAKRRRSKIGATLGLIISGVLLGLSVASKWSGGLNMMLVWIGVFIWRTTESSPKGYVLPRLFGAGFAGWNKLSFIGAGLRQGIPAIIIYIASFIPFAFMEGDWSIIELHMRMFGDVTGNMSSHPYESHWWEWPLMLEPVWYYFQPILDAEGAKTGLNRAIFLIGNPAIYWAGLPVMLGCLGYGVKRSDGVLLSVSGAYFGFWLIYAVIPRDMLFAYYYEQAALMLGIAIPVFISRVVSHQYKSLVSILWLCAALGLFVFFYPVLTAMPFEGSEWLKWRWFDFWS